MALRGKLAGFLISFSAFTLSSVYADTPTEPQVQADSQTGSDTPVTVSGTDESTSSPLTTAEPAREILAETAIMYGTFQSDAGQYNRNFNSSDDIERASKTLGSHNPQELASGWFAYSALLASESTSYANAVRRTEAHYGRDRLLLGLRNSNTYALSLDGSTDALNKALKAGDADAFRLKRIGAGITRQSRSDLQALGWAKAKLRGNSAKFASEIEAAAKDGRPMAGNVRTLFDITRLDTSLSQANLLGSSGSLWDSISVAGSSTDLRLPGVSVSGVSGTQPYSRRNRDYDFINGRIATLAAYRILGETDTNTAVLAETLNDSQVTGGMTDCISTAQLEFRGCVVGNHFVFERAFCIGEHAVADIGRCIEKVSQ